MVEQALIKLRLGGGLPAVALATALSTLLVIGGRQAGFFQSLELWAYDQFMQRRPDEGPDPRLLIVTVTEDDLKKQVKYPLPDGVLDQLLGQLERAQPAVIGLDIYRDQPVEPGHQAFLKRMLSSNRIVAVTKLGSPGEASVPPPPGLPSDRVGASDIPIDPGGITRRNLFYGTVTQGNTSSPVFAFSAVLALSYLEDQKKITLERSPIDPNLLLLGKETIQPLDAQAGGYQGIDARGYQTLLNYRSASQVARQVTLTEVLEGKVNPELIKDKIVLIGVTAESVKDLFYTPYSSGRQEEQKMPGVLLQAQQVSQILSLVLDGRPLLWFWSDAWEALWIALWAVVGGGLASLTKRPLWNVLGVGLALVGLGTACFLIFMQQGWVPLIPPALALGIATILAAALLGQRSKPALQPEVALGTTMVGPMGTQVQFDDATISAGVPTPPPTDPSTRYQPIRSLGSGGMGEVYLALDTVVGKQVALKVLKASTAVRSDLRMRFEREVAVCAALTSDNIVQVTDYGVNAQGFPFYVMEYLRGESLGQVLKQERRLSIRRAIGIINQICAGLSLAHRGVTLRRSSGVEEEIKVVHRDLKPDNIFLIPTALGELVKILDFGIVKIQNAPEEEASLTMTGQFIGTSRYAAPEQWQERDDLDQRADIYSLGVIFYEMLTGCNPFGLTSGKVTLVQWYTSHTTIEPQPLREQPDCADLPPALEAIVLRCLQKNPSQRFATVDDLRQALAEMVLPF